MKILYILAPNDRFNYGDILFPHIISNSLKTFDKCVFVSTTKSDLSKYGAMPTESLEILQKVNPNDSNYLIVAGGECLTVSWETILGYIDSDVDRLKRLMNRRFVRTISPYVLKYLSYFKRKIKTRYPFSIGKNELPAFKRVIYNSLGRCYLRENPSVLLEKDTRKILSSVDYLAVRDKLTYEALRNHGISCLLCPDSAILMSTIFTEEFLESHITVDKRKFDLENYIFFQTYAIDEQKENQLIEIIKSIYSKYKKKFVLCPIGTALGHNDQKTLLRISQKLDKEIEAFIDTPNIWDIMWLIKHSCLYSGTSLHGTITAMSFAIPFAVHGPVKLRSYIDTWAPAMGKCFSDEDGLLANIERQLERPEICDISEQMESIRRSFQKIEELLE